MGEWPESRQIAAMYQSPGATGIGFAQFASTGTVTPELWANIRYCEANSSEPYAEGWAADMARLRELLETEGITEPQQGTLGELAQAYNGDGTDFEPLELGYGQDDDLSNIRVCPGDTPETVTIVLDYQIQLDWHLIYMTTPIADGNYNSPLSDDGMELKEGWEELYWESEDSWREWFRVAGNVIAERYQGECLDMTGSVLSFAEVRTAPATLTQEELTDWIWENTSVVRLINETDPGTFNSGYLFNIIQNALEHDAPYDVESV